MRDGRQLAAAADPDVAVTIGQRRVEQPDVGLERRQQHDRIRVSCQRIVDDAPIVAVAQHVGADQAAQRHEGQALLGRLQRGVDRRAGRILDRDGAGLDRGGEARRWAVLPHGDRGGLDRGDAAGADQDVGLQAALRHRHQPETARPAAHQGPRRGDRHAGVVGRQRHQGAVWDLGGQGIDVGQQQRHGSTGTALLRTSAVGNHPGRRSGVRGLE